MPRSVLVTSTSFIDTPGQHIERLNECNYNLQFARGPLEEDELMKIIESSEGFDGILCGRDNFTSRVLEKYSPRLKVISRYGVGLDRIDLDAAAKLGISLQNTPRLNHTTVSELTFGLMISLARRIPEHVTQVRQGDWNRLTGYEMRNKTLAIFGFGMVGREVAKLALAFGMKVLVYNSSWSEVHENYFAALKSSFRNELLWGDARHIDRCIEAEEALRNADFISLHMDLNRNNAHFINAKNIEVCKQGVFIVNVSRGGLVNEAALAQYIASGKVAGYATDVLEHQPPKSNSPLLNMPNVITTPHLGGRTFDSVIKQGILAVDNLVTGLNSQDN